MDDRFKKIMMGMLMNLVGEEERKLMGVSINFDITLPIGGFNVFKYLQTCFATVTKVDIMEMDKKLLGGGHVVRFFVEKAKKDNQDIKDIFIGDTYSEIYDKLFVGDRIDPRIMTQKVSSVVLFERFMLTEDYRGMGMSHKVIKEVVNTFAEDNETLVILHAVPPQQAFHDKDNLLHQHIPKKELNNLYDDFGLDKFDNDDEMGKYKLYALCKSYGFVRLGDTDLFYYHSANSNPELDAVTLGEIKIDKEKED